MAMSYDDYLDMFMNMSSEDRNSHVPGGGYESAALSKVKNAMSKLDEGDSSELDDIITRTIGRAGMKKDSVKDRGENSNWLRMKQWLDARYAEDFKLVSQVEEEDD